MIAVTWQGMLAAVLMLYGSSDYLIRALGGKGIRIILLFLLPFALGRMWVFTTPSNHGGLVPVVAILFGLLIVAFICGIAILNAVPSPEAGGLMVGGQQAGSFPWTSPASRLYSIKRG